MTLEEAAVYLGYKNTSAIRQAVARGLLQTEKIGRRVHVTRPEWLDAYKAHVQATRGGKGKKRGPRTPPTT